MTSAGHHYWNVWAGTTRDTQFCSIKSLFCAPRTHTYLKVDRLTSRTPNRRRLIRRLTIMVNSLSQRRIVAVTSSINMAQFNSRVFNIAAFYVSARSGDAINFFPAFISCLVFCITFLFILWPNHFSSAWIFTNYSLYYSTIVDSRYIVNNFYSSNDIHFYILYLM